MHPAKCKLWIILPASLGLAWTQIPKEPEVQDASDRAWNLVLPACDGVRYVTHASGQILAIEDLTWSVKGRRASDADVDMGLYWTGTSSARGRTARILQPGAGWLPCDGRPLCHVADTLELVLWKRSSGWSTFATSESPLRRLKAMDCQHAEEVTALLSPPRPLPGLMPALGLIEVPARWEPPAPGATVASARTPATTALPPLPAPERRQRSQVWLQVIAVREESSRLVAAQLRKEGFQALTENVPDKPLVRVLVGPVDPGARLILENMGFSPFVTKARTQP